ncbi:hypothetical protein ACFC1G_15785 [Streptomyces sp. NPDC056085]|uniref:hypothetical protein n=1 Tax=Streptomyces sp. NPDC056085 TaxID=3345708 RepID=UPI0035DA2E35
MSERDEQAVAARKEATWAEVNEPGQPAEATSASRTRQASPTGRPKDAPEFGAVHLRFHASMAPSSRSSARRIGTCPLKPWRRPLGSCIPRETSGRSPT